MILDHYGREITLPEEREVSGILDVFGRWQDVGGRWAGQLLEYQDKILLEEGGTNYLAYEIYERILSDDQVIACLQQRFGIQQEYEVVPGDDSRKAKKAAALFEENLKNLRWDLITYQMKFGFFFGKAIGEVLWETQDDQVFIKDILVRDRRRFRFGKDKSLRLLTSTDTYNGINLSELYPAQFWVFGYGATHSDMPDGLGLAHYLYWPVTFKRQGVRFWLYALEKYGTNIPVAYYPAGITDAERDDLAKALVKLKHNSAISIPEGTKLEFLSGSSGIDNYEKLVQWADEAIAKTILTNTMTVEQGSSRAQAQVHEDKANSITDSDNDLLCESFNRTVLRWWTWFNFENDTPPPQIWRVKMSADTVRLVQRDKTLYDMGFPPQPEYIKETYGDGFVTDEMLSGTEGQEATASGLNGAQVSALTTLLTAGGRGDLPPDTLKAALIASFPSINQELAEQMVAPLREAVAEKQVANSPPDWNALLGSGSGEPPPETPQPTEEPPPEPSPPEMSRPEFKKNCTKGYACGDTCISKTRKCRKQAGEDKKPVIDSLRGVTATSKPKKTAPSAAKSKGKPKETAPVADTSDKQDTPAPTDKPSTFKPPINDAELARRRELLVQVAGEETVAAFEKNVQSLVDNAELMIRVPSVAVLEKIIDDRFKSQFETQSSAGTLSPVARAHVEKMMFGYDSDLSPEQRPIYGYLSNRSELDDARVSTYGDISVRLKPEVRERATLTGNDSLVFNPSPANFFPPSRLDKVNAGSFFKETDINVNKKIQLGAQALDVYDLLRRVNSSYVEAQMHGQVKPSDIKEIVFLRGERPSPKILEWAKQNNVNIAVED